MTRFLGLPRTTDGRSIAAEIIAVVALVIAFFGSGTAFFAAYHWNAALKSEGADRRATLARSQLYLCQKVYGQFTKTEEEAGKQITFTYYRQLLPTLSDTQILHLVHVARVEVNRVEAEFNPDQCYSLPAVKAFLNLKATG